MEPVVHILRGWREIADTIRDDFYDQDVVGLSIDDNDNNIIVASKSIVSVFPMNPEPRYSEDLRFLLNSTLPKKIVFDKPFVIMTLKSHYPDVKCRSIIDLADVAMESHQEELYENVIKSMEQEAEAVATGEKTSLDYGVAMAIRALSAYVEITTETKPIPPAGPELTLTPQWQRTAPTVPPPAVPPTPISTCFFTVLNELNHELRRANGQLNRQDLIRRFAGRTKKDCPFERTLDFMIERQYLHQHEGIIFLV